MYQVVVGLVILSASARPASADEQEVFKEPATGILFPGNLGKWTRVGDRTFGPGLGVSITYKFEEGAIATIYVYNANLKTIPTGAGSKVVKEHFEQIKSEVSETQKRRQGSAMLKSENEVGLGSVSDSPRALRAVFAITEKDGNELISHVYLTGYKDQFFKIRATYLRKVEKTAEDAIANLLNDLGGLLKM
jgi:hypothetical protein